MLAFSRTLVPPPRPVEIHHDARDASILQAHKTLTDRTLSQSSLPLFWLGDLLTLYVDANADVLFKLTFSFSLS